MPRPPSPTAMRRERSLDRASTPPVWHRSFCGDNNWCLAARRGSCPVPKAAPAASERKSKAPAAAGPHSSQSHLPAEMTDAEEPGFRDDSGQTAVNSAITRRRVISAAAEPVLQKKEIRQLEEGAERFGAASALTGRTGGLHSRASAVKRWARCAVSPHGEKLLGRGGERLELPGDWPSEGTDPPHSDVPQILTGAPRGRQEG
ncbi:hypothetical protein AAFF_G00237440 [Aldrovandia affinis]|uniref:Uncharacterized protein n=1 Tax=Aldrovandia affinis TaxID=143900 RepID=A0AAD7W3T5_9TELE|nr:hypothetical protein AAFF_G00237440 [Aldrovandia affinis]